jgi:threonine/homoserine/homoserine lactone efflux protein
MFSSSTLLVFSLAALGLLVIPGPAVLYIVTRSVAQGRRAGLASVVGIELATLVHSAAAALGLSAILAASALAFNIVRYAGAAYLVYLGIRTFFTKPGSDEGEKNAPQSYAQLFGKGFLVNLLNPKTALFFYAFLPQFVDPSRGAAVPQILLLGLLFVAMASCTDSIYALVGSGLGSLVTRRPKFRQVQRFVSGGIYVALGVAAAFTGHVRK